MRRIPLSRVSRCARATGTIVTTFTAGAQNTLPIWIFGQIRLGQQLPQVNVVVFLILAVTIIPVAVAQRMTRESGILRTE